MIVTQQKALEVALLLHAHRETRERLVCMIQKAFDTQQELDTERLIRRLEVSASCVSPDFQVDVNYYGLCLRLELELTDRPM
jgi:hypothetical protein